MDRLSDAYEERNRETGRQQLYPELRSRLTLPALALRKLRSKRPWQRKQNSGSRFRWFWFSSTGVRHYVVGVLLLFGIGLDTITTDILLTKGLAIEGNQLVRTAYSYAGIFGIIGVKGAIIALGVTLLRLAIRWAWAETMILWFYVACGVGWTLGGVWNLLIGAFTMGV